MLHYMWFLMPWLVFQDPVAMEAERLQSINDYFGAERIYLANEPAPVHMVPWAEDLTGIALRLGSVEGKTRFYRTYLTRGRTWRGTALFVLAGLAAYQRDWDALALDGSLFFQEFQTPPHPAKYRLLYYLARYTRLDPDTLALTDVEGTWFAVCRELAPSSVFPRSQDLLPLPEDLDNGGSFSSFYKHGYLLDSQSPFTAPPIPELQPAGNYVYLLLHLHEALVAGDEVLAVKRLNELVALDRTLADPVLRVHFYPLYRQYFVQAGQPSRLGVIDRNLNRVLNHAALPLVLIPERLQALADAPVVAVVPQPDPPTPEPTPPESEPETPADEPEPEVQPEGERTFEELEAQLLENHRGLVMSIRAKQPDTAFKRIYQNYLLGAYYLRSGRSDRALERLNLARQLIEDLPFPGLEIKILLALSEVQGRQGNGDQAEWFGIQAAQMWNAPENMAVLAADQVQAPSPYLALLDQALANTSEPSVIHQILLYSEAEHFYRLRKRAFARNAVTRNRVLDSQLRQIGGQMGRIVDELAEKPSQENPVRAYNQTLDLWNQLWKQVNPYYQNPSFPSVSEIQRSVGARDRMLIFVEGNRELGVLLITPTQALAVSLGALERFNGLSAYQKFNFLEGRLGPVWNQNGKLHLRLSPSLRRDDFVNTLRDLMEQPRNLEIQFSLRAFMSPREISACRGMAVFSEGRGEAVTQLVASLPAAGLAWFSGVQLDVETLRDRSSGPGHLIFSGTLDLTSEGLFFRTGNQSYPLHDLVHRPTRPCGVALIDPAFDQWIAAMDELELLSPDGLTTVYSLQRPEQYTRLSQVRFGLRFSWAGE